MSDDLERYKKAFNVIESACMSHGLVFDLDNPAKSLNDLILAEIHMYTYVDDLPESEDDDLDVMFELNG